MSTKDRILEEAISLFSEKGYSEVSVREIARAVGIRESSLYNHFSSKQNILDEIFELLKRQLDATAMPEETVAEMIAKLTPEAFLSMSVDRFESFLGNPAFVKVWRILSIERFTNPKAREIFNVRFIDEPMQYQANVFSALMDRGLIPRRNPMLLAREFFSYILYMYFRFIETDKDVKLSGNPEFRQMVQEHMEFLGFAFSQIGGGAPPAEATPR